MTLGASIRPSAIASASDSSPTRRGHQTHPGGEHHTHRDLTPIRAVRPARLSTKQGSEAVSAGIGLRISRSGVRISPGNFVPRASDSPGYRASDYQGPATWASDPEGPDAWASDPDWRLDERARGATEPATDPQHHPATDSASVSMRKSAMGQAPRVRAGSRQGCPRHAPEAPRSRRRRTIRRR